jgi:splicing factor 3B subunit 3
LERLDESFNQVEIPLRYTPRRFDVLPGTNLLCILEAEHNSFPYFERQKIKERLEAEEKNRARGSGGVIIKQESVNDDAMEIEGSHNQNDNLTASATQTQALPIEQQVDPRPGIGRWASCIRLLDVSDLENVKTTDLIELEENEACVSMCTCKFHDNDETFLCVGTVKDLVLEPKRSHSGPYISLSLSLSR